MQRLDAWIPFLYVNGNVCGRFRDVLERKVRFSAGTLTMFVRC
jgi:hypothetical protein